MTTDTAIPYRVIATLGDLVIAVRPVPDVEPGHQEILISYDTDRSLAMDLVGVLAGRRSESLGSALTTPVELHGAQWLRVPHSRIVDERLKELVNLGAAARMAAPSLMQLELDMAGAAPWTTSFR